jgi:DNA-binding IscR family transcriptional regulator
MREMFLPGMNGKSKKVSKLLDEKIVFTRKGKTGCYVLIMQ